MICMKKVRPQDADLGCASKTGILYKSQRVVYKDACRVHTLCQEFKRLFCIYEVFMKVSANATELVLPFYFPVLGGGARVRS